MMAPTWVEVCSPGGERYMPSDWALALAPVRRSAAPSQKVDQVGAGLKSKVGHAKTGKR